MGENEIIEKYISELYLRPKQGKIALEALEYLNKLISEQIDPIYFKVAELFCLSIKALEEKDVKALDVQTLIIKAFLNIRKKEVADVDGNVATIVFLSELYDMEPETDNPSEALQQQYTNLCDNLNDMSVIFRITNEEGKKAFPIGRLLDFVIREADFFSDKLDEVTFNTLLLALEIFNTDEYARAAKTVKKIVKECNLRCLEYVADKRTVKVGGALWKDNLKYNESLSLIVSVNNKKMIYVRHPRKEYFTGIPDSELQEEKNPKGIRIAFFCLREIDEQAKPISVDKIVNNGLGARLEELCKLVFENKVYNVFSNNALLIGKNGVFTANPFAMNDRWIVYPEGVHAQSADADSVINVCMKNKRFIGKGTKFDFVLLTSLLHLFKKDSSSIEYVFASIKRGKGLQEKAIKSWLLNSKDFTANLIWLNGVYKQKVEYIRKKETLEKRLFSDTVFLPYKFPYDVITDFIRKEYFTKKGMKIVKLKAENDFDETIFWDSEKKVKVSEEKIEFGDNEAFSEGDFYVIYSENDNCYFYNSEINQLMRIYETKEEVNKGLVSPNQFDCIDDTQVNDVLDKMLLQKNALSEIAGDNYAESFELIARIRLMHHLICYRLYENARWKAFIQLLDFHQIIKFDVVRKLDLRKEGLWVIPKESSNTDNALVSIIDNYCSSKAHRTTNLFNNEIQYNKSEKKYYSNGKEIKEMLFLFDTLQSGTSTVDVLKTYFGEVSTPSKEVITYYCNGKAVPVTKVIESNKPCIKVKTLYGTKAGKEKVNNYLGKNKWLKSCKIECLVEFNNAADKKFIELMGLVYKDRSKENMPIVENSYPIIREFNQPKRNAIPETALNPDNIVAIFVKKPEQKLKI